MVCDHCGSDTHRTGSGNCSRSCALCQTPGHRQKYTIVPHVRFKFASAANARQSAIRHANVHQSMHALTVALKRIVPEAGTAQTTARCAKHPVMDRSLARARSASAASANKSDTRLENAKSKATAPLRVVSMAEILWMMLTIKMPTPAR